MSFEVNFKLKLTGLPAGIPRSTRDQMLKAAFHATGVEWHTELRPEKFTRAGARKYHYERRTKKYRATKRKRFGHDNPLEFSGVSKTSSRIRDVRASSKKSRVVTQARAFNIRPKGHKRTLAEEYTAITQGDAKQISERFAVVLGRLIRNYQKSVTRSL